MENYLLIESRDTFDVRGPGFCCELAGRLLRRGDRVSVLLVQNGVLPARAGARAGALAELAVAGAEVMADDFSLRERAIAADALISGVTPVSLEVVVDRMTAGWKIIWH